MYTTLVWLRDAGRRLATIGRCDCARPGRRTPRPSGPSTTTAVLRSTATFDLVPRTEEEQARLAGRAPGPAPGHRGRRPGRGHHRLRLPLRLPGQARLRHDRGELGLRGRRPSGGGHRPGPARGAHPAGRPGTGSTPSSPASAGTTWPRSACTRRAGSSSWAWSGRSGASSTAGSMCRCSSACSERLPAGTSGGRGPD